MKSSLLLVTLASLLSTAAASKPSIYIYKAAYYNNREQLDYQAIDVTHLLPKRSPVLSWKAKTADNWVQYEVGNWDLPRYGSVTWAFSMHLEDKKPDATPKKPDATPKKPKSGRGKRLEKICVSGQLYGLAKLGGNLSAEYAFVVDGPWDNARYVDSRTIIGTQAETSFNSNMEVCIPVVKALADTACDKETYQKGDFLININANLAVKELVGEKDMAPGTIGKVTVDGSSASWKFEPVWGDCDYAA